MSDLIVKDNALMNASYNLALVEQRLILLAIIEARESGKGINANDPLTVHAESYINQFKVERHTAYQALKDACKDLFARQFSYQEKRVRGRANITSRWVSQVAYIDETATVEIIFAPAVVPLITRLEEQFTKYEIDQVSRLSSAYAIRMYELLICWRSTGKTPVIELNELRKRMGVLDTEYTRSDNFKRWVLDNPLKQINEHTDITASYEQHKKGRVITGFQFKFKQKKTAEKTVPETKRGKTPRELAESIDKGAKNSDISDLTARARKITGEIMAKGLADRFKQRGENKMEMLKRIQSEITSFEMADQYENKLREFG